MIIDLFSHIGPRKGEFYKVESLLELEDQAGVDKVMICSQLETIDNGYIFDCTQRYPDRTLGFGVINPWDMDGEEELERCFRDYNFYGVKMNPIRFGYSADRKSFAGTLCESFLSQFHFSKAFLGADGFSLEDGFSTSEIETAHLTGVAAALADSTYVLLDSTKLGRRSFVVYDKFESIRNMITDSAIDPDTVAALGEKNVRVFIAD